MINYSLLSLLEKVLGEGKATSGDNFAFFCPICKHRKRKLEIKLVTNLKGENPYHCWTCVGFKGKTLFTLFDKLKLPKKLKSELKGILKPTSYIHEKSQINSLPKEFKPLSEYSTSIFYTKAINYLKNRGINKYDILRYNIGYCLDGDYMDRVIIPSYDENKDLSFFIARSFNNNAYEQYKNPKVSKDIIFNEFFINWNQPIILCEGVFDALAIKRNAIPLLGKDMSTALLMKLVTSKVEKIYIALDNDAMKATLKHSEYLLSKGKEVYLVELQEKDPSKIGFEKFTNLIQTIQPLTFQKLLLKKMETNDNSKR